MSTATIVSLLPYSSKHTFPNCVPQEFIIPAAKSEKEPGLLLVPDVKFTIYIDSDRPPLPQITPAIKAAQSVCHDLKTSQFLVELGVQEPGLFAVEGDYTNRVDKLFTEHKDAVEAAKEMQAKWFKATVSYADDLWQRTRRRSAISDRMVDAAKFLGLQREWIIDREIEAAATKCPVCFNLVNPMAVVCGFCRAVLRADALEGITFLDDKKAPVAKPAVPATPVKS